MKLKFTFACIAVAALAVGFAANSEASLVVDFTTTTNFVGTVSPDAPPGSPESEGNKINVLIGVAASSSAVIDSKTYTRSNLAGPFDPIADVSDYFKQDSGATTLPLGNLVAQYIFGKYGNVGYVWYSESGFTGDVMLPGTAGASNNALSHSTAFNLSTVVVPEAGSLLVWGGLALTGLCVFRRKLFA